MTRHFEDCTLCLDMGTTRTRVWFVVDGSVKAKLVGEFGVRDRAIAPQSQVVEGRLSALLQDALQVAGAGKANPNPTCIAAAGMIGSPSGFVDLPHVPAPAGLEELAARVHMIRNPAISSLPMYVVPGVRTTHAEDGIRSIEAGDLMRGEESLCMGLLHSGVIGPGGAVLNLGSHWKWIVIGADGRIARSRTSLTGEMIHAVQAHTLLASALPPHRPLALAPEWLEHGARQARSEGLTRALFCVRLLEQAKTGSAEERLAYLYGAVIETELGSMARSPFFHGLQSVTIVGAPALAMAWKEKLSAFGFCASVLSEADTEQNYLAGLRAIVANSGAREKQNEL